MRKFPQILLALLLVCSLLCGCSSLQAIQKDQTLTFQDLSITLPSYFDDMTDPNSGVTIDGFFMYGYQEIMISGIREDYSLFEEVPSLEEYGKLLIENNSLNSQLEVIDGLTTFTFSQLVNDSESYTYITSIYAGTDAFWMVQAGCRTMNMSSTRDKLIDFLKTVVVA